VLKFTLYRASISGCAADRQRKVDERAGIERRATDRLLRHLTLVGRMVGGERAPARLRLESKLGAPLARRLLTDSCGPPPPGTL
jgi:hypothetical protein